MWRSHSGVWEGVNSWWPISSYVLGFNLLLGIVIEVRGQNWDCITLAIGRGKLVYELDKTPQQSRTKDRIEPINFGLWLLKATCKKWKIQPCVEQLGRKTNALMRLELVSVQGTGRVNH